MGSESRFLGGPGGSRGGGQFQGKERYLNKTSFVPSLSYDICHTKSEGYCQNSKICFLWTALVCILQQHQHKQQQEKGAEKPLLTLQPKYKMPGFFGLFKINLAVRTHHTRCCRGGVGPDSWFEIAVSQSSSLALSHSLGIKHQRIRHDAQL